MRRMNGLYPGLDESYDWVVSRVGWELWMGCILGWMRIMNGLYPGMDENMNGLYPGMDENMNGLYPGLDENYEWVVSWVG